MRDNISLNWARFCRSDLDKSGPRTSEAFEAILMTLVRLRLREVLGAGGEEGYAISGVGIMGASFGREMQAVED